MNNNQFRRLVLDKFANQDGAAQTTKANATPATLGTKRSSFMPMTPRTVKGGIDIDFARQVRDRNATLQPSKKFKTAAPKGVKYGAGYTDRARVRAEADDDNNESDKAGRIKALEEQMKLGQISVETFEALRDEITGGDVASTHLVKGLDRKLLERVRRGEDVLGARDSKPDTQPPTNIDEELDKLGDKDVKIIQKEKAEKRGTMALPPAVAGVKRSRDELMAELKAQRKAAAEAKSAPALDSSRWRKVGEKEKSRIEIDHKGREVLITVDQDGVVKRKVRKVSVHDQENAKMMIEMPDASKAVLGADVNMPMPPKPLEDGEDDDDDIFEGVGAEHNPLGDQDEESEDEDETVDRASDSDAHDTKVIKKPSPTPKEAATSRQESTDIHRDKRPTIPRNYFQETISNSDEPSRDRLAGVQDLLKKAAKIDPTRHTDGNGERDDGDDIQAARLKKRAEMLAQQDRDLADMDMGFGGGRYDDGDDDVDQRIKLSEWKGSAGGVADTFHAKEKDGGTKKRKSKKRKGEANNMADILGVIEARKTSSGK